MATGPSRSTPSLRRPSSDGLGRSRFDLGPPPCPEMRGRRRRIVVRHCADEQGVDPEARERDRDVRLASIEGRVEAVHTLTWQPLANRASATCDPMNPPRRVMRTFMPCLRKLEEFVYLVAGKQGTASRTSSSGQFHHWMASSFAIASGENRYLEDLGRGSRPRWHRAARLWSPPTVRPPRCRGRSSRPKAIIAPVPINSRRRPPRCRSAGIAATGRRPSSPGRANLIRSKTQSVGWTPPATPPPLRAMEQQAPMTVLRSLPS